MDLGKFEKYRSWLYSAGIAILIAGWLLSGQFGNSDDATNERSAAIAKTTIASQSKVRVRTQIAEEVTRTIIVNGKTAPARVVELSAETDGRVVSIGAKRGANIDRDTVIVRLDERDRSARLAQAEATVR